MRRLHVRIDVGARLPLLDGAKDVRKIGPLEQLVGDAARLAARLAGKLDQLGQTREECKDAAYQPFPELERLKR